MVGTFLCVELGTFSVADYVISKTLDIGTGKLWPEIKRRFTRDRETVESLLYDAIETSVRKYSELNDRDHIAQACEHMEHIGVRHSKIAIVFNIHI